MMQAGPSAASQDMHSARRRLPARLANATATPLPTIKILGTLVPVSSRAHPSDRHALSSGLERPTVTIFRRPMDAAYQQGKPTNENNSSGCFDAPGANSAKERGVRLLRGSMDVRAACCRSRTTCGRTGSARRRTGRSRRPSYYQPTPIDPRLLFLLQIVRYRVAIASRDRILRTLPHYATSATRALHRRDRPLQEYVRG